MDADFIGQKINAMAAHDLWDWVKRAIKRSIRNGSTPRSEVLQRLKTLFIARPAVSRSPSKMSLGSTSSSVNSLTFPEIPVRVDIS